MTLSKYRFEEIAINCTQKRFPTEEDQPLYIGLEHLDTGNLHVDRWGSSVPLKGEKLVMRKGDVLLGRRNAYLRRAAVAPHDGLFSAHGMVLQPREDVIDRDFFPLFIASDYFFDEANRISVGSLSPTINWKDLRNVEFELPNKEKQRELAKVLWALDATKRSYQKLLKKTDELVKAQFIDMFYGEKHNMVPLSTMVDRSINNLKSISDEFKTIRYIDISSIDNAKQRVTSYTEYLINDAPSRAQQVLKRGDILVSTVRPNLRNIAINPYSEPNVVGSTGFCVLRCNEGYLPEYIWGIVNSDKFTKAMCEKATGISYPAVRDKDVLNFEAPDAPLDLQKKFATFVQQSNKSKFELEKSLAELTTTYKKILSENLG